MLFSVYDRKVGLYSLHLEVIISSLATSTHTDHCRKHESESWKSRETRFLEEWGHQSSSLAQCWMGPSRGEAIDPKGRQAPSANLGSSLFHCFNRSYQCQYPSLSPPDLVLTLFQISNARVAGMGEDLGLEIGSRYTIALVVFFIPYFIFEVGWNFLD